MKVLSLNKLTLELALEVRALPSSLEECECVELHFRRGVPLACRVMGIACYSLPPVVPPVPAELR